jgi:molybdenum cofactor cytidylyltransferase
MIARFISTVLDSAKPRAPGWRNYFRNTDSKLSSSSADCAPGAKAAMPSNRFPTTTSLNSPRSTSQRLRPVLGSRGGVCYLRSMGRSLSFCGVILAAGESSRMGRDKALLPWPPESSASITRETFLSAAIRLFTPYVDIVLVVAGKNGPDLAPIVYAQGASLLVNPDPARGQFSSLQIGLQEVLNRGRDAAMITLVDRPPVQLETIQFLATKFEQASEQSVWAVVPEYHGKHGHPILAGREMIEAFLRAPAGSNAREVEHSNQDKIAYVQVEDPFVVMNVDTPEQYAALSTSTV